MSPRWGFRVCAVARAINMAPRWGFRVCAVARAINMAPRWGFRVCAVARAINMSPRWGFRVCAVARAINMAPRWGLGSGNMPELRVCSGFVNPLRATIDAHYVRTLHTCRPAGALVCAVARAINMSPRWGLGSGNMPELRVCSGFVNPLRATIDAHYVRTLHTCRPAGANAPKFKTRHPS